MKAVGFYGAVSLEAILKKLREDKSTTDLVPLVDVQNHVFHELSKETVLERYCLPKVSSLSEAKHKLIAKDDIDPHGAISLKELSRIRREPALKLTNLVLDYDIEEADSELREFVNNGGFVFCDTTPRGRGRDIHKLNQIADELKKYITFVVGTGWCFEHSFDYKNPEINAEQFRRLFVGNVIDGFRIEGKVIGKAGIIGEIILSSRYVHCESEKSLQCINEANALTGAIQAHAETDGCPVVIRLEPDSSLSTEAHHKHTLALLEKVVNTFTSIPGVQAKRVAISGALSNLPGHLSLEGATAYALKLSTLLTRAPFKLIVTLSHIETDDYPEGGSIPILAAILNLLIEAGHKEQLLVGGSISFKTQLMRCGGWGYGRLHNVLLRQLRSSSLDATSIRAIFVDNAIQFLSYYTPPAAPPPKPIKYWSCDFCGKEKPETFDAFEKSGYKYCSMKCLKKHKQQLEEENGDKSDKDNNRGGKRKANTGSTSWGIAVGSS